MLSYTAMAVFRAGHIGHNNAVLCTYTCSSNAIALHVGTNVSSIALQSWKSQVKAYVAPSDAMFSKILVPTVDVVRSTWLLSTTLGAGRPCLFVGESGTAKTATIQHFLNTWLANNNLVLNMNFSSRTSSADVQRAIEVSQCGHILCKACNSMLHAHDAVSL